MITIFDAFIVIFITAVNCCKTFVGDFFVNYIKTTENSANEIWYSIIAACYLGSYIFGRLPNLLLILFCMYVCMYAIKVGQHSAKIFWGYLLLFKSWLLFSSRVYPAAMRGLYSFNHLNKSRFMIKNMVFEDFSILNE